ncbi:MAG: hypothetical protein QY332_10810 [Anaerolineales bacterium]|nr:MAG: hypothetical protein QY332_10810 [Anaerolineales bacterium]
MNNKIKLSVKNFFEKTEIGKLTLIISATPILILIVWGIISEQFLDGEAPQLLNMIIFAACGLLIGSAGLIQIRRQEAPWLMGKKISGVKAIISGALLLGIFWGLSVLILIFYFLETIAF